MRRESVTDKILEPAAPLGCKKLVGRVLWVRSSRGGWTALLQISKHVYAFNLVSLLYVKGNERKWERQGGGLIDEENNLIIILRSKFGHLSGPTANNRTRSDPRLTNYFLTAMIKRLLEFVDLATRLNILVLDVLDPGSLETFDKCAEFCTHIYFVLFVNAANVKPHERRHFLIVQILENMGIDGMLG